MNSVRNQVRLIGHLGKDFETKSFEGGSVVANGSMATNEIYKNQKGERKEETQWHKIVAWGKTADLMSTLLGKGDQVVIEGKLVYRTYEDSAGVKRQVSEVLVNNFYKLTKTEQ